MLLKILCTFEAFPPALPPGARISCYYNTIKKSPSTDIFLKNIFSPQKKPQIYKSVKLLRGKYTVVAICFHKNIFSPHKTSKKQTVCVKLSASDFSKLKPLSCISKSLRCRNCFSNFAPGRKFFAPWRASGKPGARKRGAPKRL